MTRPHADAGFRELEHTADWALEVWAPTWAGLLEQAARGMYALLRLQVDPTTTAPRALHVRAADAESLLVDFLSELLFWLETDRVAGTTFHLQATPTEVRGTLQVAPVQRLEKEIKAVTYHNLRVQHDASGWRAVVTFDV